MKAATHLAFAGLLGIGAAGFGADITGIGGAGLAVGALLPDIDTTRSTAGRLAPRAARRLERRFGHRTITHSLLALAGLAALASPLLVIHNPLWITLLAGYASHLLLDTANVSGVPLLWPLRVRFWLLGNRAWRVPYGSPKERAWLAAIGVSALALAPLARDGFTPWFHRALGTSYGAVEDYLRWKDTHEVWAEVRGSNLVTGEQVHSRYRVVDALHTEMLLVEDAGGAPYSVGLGQQADISATRVRVWAGAPVRTTSERLDLGGGTIGDLLARLPSEAASVHLTATLHTPDPGEPEAAVGRYPRVRRFGGALELRSATPAELEGLAHLWIENGSAVVRLTFAPGAEPAPLRPAASGNGERIVLRLADLPDLAALRIEAGERITPGVLIAVYPPDAEVEARRRALESTHARTGELAAASEAARRRRESERERLAAAYERARDDLDRAERLAERGALPAADLRAAQALTEEREAALSEHDAEAGQQERTEALRLREAAREHERLARELAASLATLEVRAAVAGRVASIRTLGADRSGVDVEIVILAGGHPN